MRPIAVDSPWPRGRRLEAFTVAILAAGTIAVLLAIARNFDVGGLHVPSVFTFCFLREVAGVPCPLCGGTRAMVALAHGHPGTALAANPFVALAAMTVLAGPALVLVPGIDRTCVTARRLATPAFLWPLFLAEWGYVIVHLAH